MQDETENSRWGGWWSKAAAIGLLLVTIIAWTLYRTRKKHDYPKIPLAHAMQHMKTGDLVLFSGRSITLESPGRMVRRALFLGATYAYRALDNCEWAHTATVYRPPDDPSQVWIVHSELASNKDVVSGTMSIGVQVTSLKDKLETYKGYCVWRPINREVDSQKMQEFLRLTYHLNYRIPGDIWMRFIDRLIRARERRRNPRDVASWKRIRGVFCTEFTGALYEHCGVFGSDTAPFRTYYIPSDFAEDHPDSYLINGYSFDDIGFELTLS